MIQITISVEMYEALKSMQGSQDYLSPELLDELWPITSSELREDITSGQHWFRSAIRGPFGVTVEMSLGLPE